jgi:anti-sigma factor RsiW
MERDPNLDQELHALIDGELEGAAAQSLAARLGAEPGLAERAARFRADRDRLRQVYGPLSAQPVPAAILQRLDLAGVESEMPRHRRWLPAAAALATAAAVTLFVWLGTGAITPRFADPLIAKAIAIRDGSERAELQIAPDAVSRDALDDVLARSFKGAPRVPDLGKAGYRLAGIFLYPDDDGRHSVELSYRDAQDRLFTVYLTHPAEPQGFALVEQGKLRLCIWKNEDLSAVMVGEMSTDDMLRVASLTYGDLNF